MPKKIKEGLMRTTILHKADSPGHSVQEVSIDTQHKIYEISKYNIWRPRILDSRKIIVTTHKNYYSCCKTSQSGRPCTQSSRIKHRCGARNNFMKIQRLEAENSSKIIVKTHAAMMQFILLLQCSETSQSGQSRLQDPVCKKKTSMRRT